MEIEKNQLREILKKDLYDVLIRSALIAVLVFASFKIFHPFLSMMLWGLVLAVTLFPSHQNLAARLGGKQGRAATIIVLLGVLFIGGPAVMLSNSMIDVMQQTYSDFQKGEIQIEEPAAGVAQWPIVGKKVYSLWHEAAKNLPALIKEIKPKLETYIKPVLSFTSAMVGDLFQFLFSMIIAGIMLAYGHSASERILKIINRLAGQKRGKTLHTLSTATIRSVAMGVIGVATIQALIFGVGFMLIGLPAAGVVALLVLLFGIAQLPAIIFTIPTVAFIWWSGDSTIMNIVFTIYFVIGGFVDNVLKPIFLGRGVDAPMPVVLLGALGGMVTSGLIGLFIGAIFLSLAYVIFMAWVDDDSTQIEDAVIEPLTKG